MKTKVMLYVRTRQWNEARNEYRPVHRTMQQIELEEGEEVYAYGLLLDNGEIHDVSTSV